MHRGQYPSWFALLMLPVGCGGESSPTSPDSTVEDAVFDAPLFDTTSLDTTSFDTPVDSYPSESGPEVAISPKGCTFESVGGTDPVSDWSPGFAVRVLPTGEYEFWRAGSTGIFRSRDLARTWTKVVEPIWPKSPEGGGGTPRDVRIDPRTNTVNVTDGLTGFALSDTDGTWAVSKFFGYLDVRASRLLQKVSGAVSLDNGTTWGPTPPGTVSAGGLTDMGTAFVTDLRDFSDHSIRRSIDGVSWSATGKLPYDSSFTFVVGFDGTLYAAWSAGMHFGRSVDDGVSWSTLGYGDIAALLPTTGPHGALFVLRDALDTRWVFLSTDRGDTLHPCADLPVTSSSVMRFASAGSAIFVSVSSVGIFRLVALP
ncbi:MAG: hypothetical protein ACXWUG_18020 [Polyangiales bacterium]